MNAARQLVLGGLPLLILLAAGCATSRLQPQDFQGRTIAATANFSPAPLVDHPLLAPYTRYRPTALMRDEQRDLERFQRHLHAAARRVDVPATVAGEMLLLSADQLGARTVANPETADYVLDFRVHHYGLRLRSFRAHARFFIDAEARLIERATNEPVWTKRLHGSRTFDTGASGIELSRLSEAALADVLAGLAADAAERMKAALSDDIKPAS